MPRWSASGEETDRPTSPVTLYATVFIVGAVVMVVEILGTRIIGPVFGVNLFVWSALLAVTMCSLAGGYYAGGVLADRIPGRRILGWMLLSAGGLLGLGYQSRRVVLDFGENLGPRAGSLFAAAILFGPCLTALGMVSPAAVRLATRTVSATGHRVGAVYAISTIGSVVGTLLTGFVLLPAVETSWIIFGAAALLGATGALLLAANRRHSATALLVVLIAWPSAPIAPPPGIDLLYRDHSLYGLIEVLDDKHRSIRFLRADHSIIGAHWLADRSACFAFVHILESARLLRPDAKKALQIGLGIGSVPVALAAHGVSSDIVEIDENVVRVAKDFFGFAPTGAVYVEDARTLTRRLPVNQYDIIIHDTFTGGTTPEHLLTVEFLRQTKSTLRKGGVLAVNVPGYHQGDRSEASRSVLATLKAVFANVRAFRDMAPAELPDSVANIVFFASDGPLEFSLPPPGGLANEASERAARSLASWEVLRDGGEGRIITDDNNPLSRMQIATAFEHFRAMNELLPKEVWLR